ncbi:PTS sugar transporter subunit IIB [Enterococcus rivorum]|uniref:PTS fructose transporter subunit IIB n=1 Tax=Enterococcus rivorum TaxID=762845 RepID=A0A1E5KZ30_9ENTE|nr:PTS sugar transporter subunit IIB [Enterococcus rivorum]MBP2097676.1 PTS system galactitol-specific IIB component [Enterococcus rivorum]OEH83115.1 PTS fructose transporter subunit IIB [Enterococcus rivorum]
MKKVNIISVCGSGTVTSSMVAEKVKDFLSENGFRAQTVEVNPNGVDSQLESGSWDVIVHTSPLKKKYELPTINSVGLLTGMGEEEFFEELLETVQKLDLA